VKRSLIVPRAALAEMPAGRSFTPGVVLDRSSPAVRLLVSHINSVWQILPQMSGQGVAGARRATLDLLAAVITPAMCRDLVRSSTIRTTVERWIDRQLPLGDVSPRAAAAAHGVSLRTLHRTFDSGGPSFSSYVRQRRCARARAELDDPGVLISSAARRWGYADASQFGRIFRRLYGMSPGDYRGTMA
jgi:AraC-like DNA-binding protein